MQLAGRQEQLIEDKELAQLISFAVAALPEQRRLIFRLIKEEGLKSSAVAAILGISTRTVENQLYKAVKVIAGSISGYLGYHPQKKISRKDALSAIKLLFFLTGGKYFLKEVCP
jgi:RNA polymerase sigma-70 factor (ECF subfamily)